MSEEDDKPTVVLDLNKLKEELDSRKDSGKIIDQDIEINFSSSPDNPKAETIEEKNIVFYEAAGEDELSQLASDAQFKYRIITELKDLNQAIKEKDLNLVFYYGKNQKTITSLLKQINAKNLPINTILLAKNLSDQKAKAHAQTAFAAKEYLSYPASIEELFDKCK